MVKRFFFHKVFVAMLHVQYYLLRSDFTRNVFGVCGNHTHKCGLAELHTHQQGAISYTYIVLGIKYA